jgi:hypothetical protein
LERIVIETDLETKTKLHDLAYQEKKTIKQLMAEAIEKILKRLKT